MKHLMKLTWTLVLLCLTAASAWAQEELSESINVHDDQAKQLVFVGEHFTISGTKVDDDGLVISDGLKVTVASNNGEIIQRADIQFGIGLAYFSLTTSTKGTVNCQNNVWNGSITDINATNFEISNVEEDPLVTVHMYKITLYYTLPDPTIPVQQEDLSWEFTMPAANKLLLVEYFPSVLTLEANDIAMGSVDVVKTAIGQSHPDLPLRWHPIELYLLRKWEHCGL